MPLQLDVTAEKGEKLRQSLLQILPRYSDADSNVLSEYIVAISKNQFSDVEQLRQQFSRDLAPFITRVSTDVFLDLLLDLYVQTGIVDANEFSSQNYASPRDRHPPRYQGNQQYPQQQTDRDQQYIDRSQQQQQQQQHDRFQRGHYDLRAQRDSYDRDSSRYGPPDSRGRGQHYQSRQRFSPYSSGRGGGGSQQDGYGDRRRDNNSYGAGRFDRAERRSVSKFTNKISVVNVPAEILTPSETNNNPEQVIRDYFSKYGPIKNVNIYPMEGKCIVEFDSGDDEQRGVEMAQKAFEDPAAVLNNRFIKVYNVREYVSRDRHGEDSGESGDNSADQEVEMVKMTAEELQQKKEQNLQLQQALSQQMQELAKKQDEQRRLLMANIGHLNEEEKNKILQQLQAVSSVIKLPTAKIVKAEEQPQVDVETRTMQSDLQAAQQNAQSNGSDVQMPQVQPQGVQPWSGTAPIRGAYAGRRARGRGGRGTSSGRGGGAAAFSLDNRPRTLVVSPYNAVLKQPTYMKAGSGMPGPSILLKHLHKFGYVEASDAVGDGAGQEVLRVRFSKQWEAEKCIKEGSTVSVSEYTKNEQDSDIQLSFELVSNDTIQSPQSAAKYDSSINSMFVDMDVEMEDSS
ncbi:hypothetical protein MIR68_005229 [Amoeboaphelidium protococcarum]|nr:hypothetical protein MIR68_005229 [Amoeboaphelidium protococcarum]